MTNTRLIHRKTPKAAGMICVALSRPTENPQDLSAADLIVNDLAEFTV